MANATEIKNRIRSIQDTMKITKAMYMISSNKLQKAKQSRLLTEPFFYGIQMQIARLLRHIPDIKHVYFDNDLEETQANTEKKRGIIVITGDKGFAGAYNHNILKAVEEFYQDSQKSCIYVVGEMGYHYFQQHHIPIEENFHYVAQNPTMHRARLIADQIISAYNSKKLDEVYIIYTRMVNSIVEEVKVEKLLPLVRTDFSSEEIAKVLASSYQEEFRFIPSPEVLLDHMVPNYITGYIYGALIEAFSCEQNARMAAMKAATDNASTMLHDLSIAFNRARQAAITQEITEVVGGAKALKRKKLKQAE